MKCQQIFCLLVDKSRLQWIISMTNVEAKSRILVNFFTVQNHLIRNSSETSESSHVPSIIANVFCFKAHAVCVFFNNFLMFGTTSLLVLIGWNLIFRANYYNRNVLCPANKQIIKLFTVWNIKTNPAVQHHIKTNSLVCSEIDEKQLVSVQ